MDKVIQKSDDFTSMFHNLIMIQDTKQEIQNFIYFVMHEKNYMALLPQSNWHSSMKIVNAHFWLLFMLR